MALFHTLSPAEQARQLANPEGRVGLEVAEWLNGNNRDSNAKTLDLLDLKSGCHVLEIGFGNGRAAPAVTGRASDIRYAGVDISPTMVDEAKRFNSDLITSGRASFHLCSAELLPFADASFDRVFSTGVIHFWSDVVAPLVEVRRVMRRDGLAVMGTPDPGFAAEFAQPQFGFYLRSAEEWHTLFCQAGFISVDARVEEVAGITPDGRLNKRRTVRIIART
jgi:ubiquinone/menaquinone biosynthesis C-methylase UbiE